MTTREEALALAAEAGFNGVDYRVESFVRLIDLAKAKENEACEAIAERMANHAATGEEIAEAIRARMEP